jgi:hypothetical protein
VGRYNCVSRKVSVVGTKREEVALGCKQLHNEELFVYNRDEKLLD